MPAGGIDLGPPKQREHGDWSSNVALQVAKPAGLQPREAAGRIVTALEAAPPRHVERIEIAGPGFVNFHLAPTWLHEVLRDVVAEGDRYGHGSGLAGWRINLEFVSANPTGPLHAGGGRWVAVGDAIANLLAAQGAEVHREYYLNDAGNQLDLFAASLYARYRGAQPPEDGYQGEYLVEMADRMRAELGDDVTEDAGGRVGLRGSSSSSCATTSPGSVCTSTRGSPSAPCTSAARSSDVLTQLATRGATFEHEGATWLRTTDFGDQRDRVLVKSDGSTTYLCNDLAYHEDKFDRGWTHLIDIWGADHHGQVKSLQAGLEALGHPAGRAGGAARPAREGAARRPRSSACRNGPGTSSRSPTSSTRSTPTSAG